MKVVDCNATKLLEKIFSLTPMDYPLFDASAYQYRKRWDLILSILGVPKSFRLTPGGLRGGAAVHHYKAGRPIQDLMWLLRLRSQVTLESYLQEVSALNLLAKLPDEAKSCIKLFAATFAFLAVG